MIEEKAPAKMDIEKEETKEPEVEEAPTTILSNPSRVLKKQMNYIEYMNDNRYQPITKDRKRGYIFLRDTTEDIIDEYVDDEPLQAWLIPPPDFIFNPSLQHN